MRRFAVIILGALAIVAVAHPGPAAWRPGARSGTRLDGETTTLGGRVVEIWRPAGDGPAPIIVFSHGYSGCPGQSSFLTKALAKAGYLVVAPRHADAICGGNGLSPPQQAFWQPWAWSDATYRDRRDDIVAVLDALRVDPKFAGKIDWSRLGLMGHSLGGYTVLGLAGAWPGWRLPGVKAVVALSPFCLPFLTADPGLRGISVPVKYQGGTDDFLITPTVGQSGGCYDQTPAPALFVDLKDAGHLAWTDLASTDHADMVFYARAFFDQWLRGQGTGRFSERQSGVVELRVK